jgi:hypothetical protein
MDPEASSNYTAMQIAEAPYILSSRQENLPNQKVKLIIMFDAPLALMQTLKYFKLKNEQPLSIISWDRCLADLKY